jgi:hypothetical protein
MSVNKERVQLLVDALRSGEFQQVGGVLRRAGGGHCCLGVATEVALRNDFLPPEDEAIGELWDHENGETLHEVVRDWYGFDDDDPTIIVTADDGVDVYITATEANGVDVYISATEANDATDSSRGGVHRYPFNEIAAGFHRMYLEDSE